MKLVVDTNILMTFFWKESTFSSLLPFVELCTPSYALDELSKHQQEIVKKSKCANFQQRLATLKKTITFISEEAYTKEAALLRKTISTLPKEEEFLKDLDFLALAKNKNLPLWSNDKLLKKQEHVAVLTTKELILLLRIE